jgi:hypothetical protein
MTPLPGVTNVCAKAFKRLFKFRTCLHDFNVLLAGIEEATMLIEYHNTLTINGLCPVLVRPGRGRQGLARNPAPSVGSLSSFLQNIAILNTTSRMSAAASSLLTAPPQQLIAYFKLTVIGIN